MSQLYECPDCRMLTEMPERHREKYKKAHERMKEVGLGLDKVLMQLAAEAKEKEAWPKT